MKMHFGSAGVDLTNPEHVQQLRTFFRRANERQLAIVAHLWSREWEADESRPLAVARTFLNEVLPAAADVPVQIAHAGGAGRYVHDDVLALFADASPLVIRG